MSSCRRGAFVPLALALALAACAEAPAAGARPSGAQIANPAAVACVRQGGELVGLRTAAGEVGYCRLPDGRTCEEWALFRDGRCVAPPPASQPPTP